MSKERSYYFVNHSRNEFIYFSKNISVVEALNGVLNNYVGWSAKDNIRIDSEAHDSTECLERMDDMRFTLAKAVRSTLDHP